MKGRNWRNLPVLVFFVLFALANAVFHREAGQGGFAGLGMALIDRRKQRAMGDGWSRLLPRRILRGAGRPLRLAAAVAVWWGLALLHPVVIGPVVL